MVRASEHEILGASRLTERQLEDARELLRFCNQRDGLDLKLAIAPQRPPEGGAPRAFLSYAGERLVGFAQLDGFGGPEMELCGMVHPDYRRRGIGTALLRAALAGAGRQMGVVRVLVIVEDASTSGRAFIARQRAERQFSEYRMEIAAPPAQRNEQRLELHTANLGDVPAIARVISAAFGQMEDDRIGLIARDMRDGEQFLLGTLGGEAITSLKVFRDPPKAYIYAFGVLPEYRRHGYGREMLSRVIQRLFAEGVTAVGLEVDADNTPARALYQSVGFHDVTVYGYYALAPRVHGG